MLCAVFILIFALGSPALAGTTNDPKGLKPKNENCFANTQVKNAEDGYKTCFQNQLLRSTSDRCQHDKTYNIFVNAVEKSCNKNSTSKLDQKPYLDLVRFSMLHDLTGDFVEHGPTCMKEKEKEVTNCVETYNAQSKNKQLGDETERLWRKSMLTFTTEACAQSKLINACVAGVLSSCSKNVPEYVKSLYDYVHVNCDLLDIMTKLKENLKASPAVQSTADSAVVTQVSSPAVTALLVLFVLAILYVLVRDFKHRMLPCMGRASSGESRQMDTLGRNS